MNLTKRLGAAIGRGWRAYVRIEKRFRAYLMARGANDPLATFLVWTVRATILGAIGFYVVPVFSVALYYVASGVIVIGIVIAALYAAERGDIDLSPPKAARWRNGHSGTGLYTDDDVRIDDHDPNNPRDVES